MATQQQEHGATRARDEDAFDVVGHHLRLIVEGPARLDALLATIAAATRELLLLYYIFASDDCGTRVRDALIAAAERGVEVALVVDGFGSETTADGFFEPLRAAGARVCRFLPRYGRRYLLRNHQKMAIADARIAIVGGFNVEQGYFAESGPDGWRDLAMRVEGPAVAHLAGYFLAIEAWTRKSGARILVLNRIIRRWSQQEGPLRWLFGGPTNRMSPWAEALRRDLPRARRLDMIAAYFAPNPGARRRLGRMARRGVFRLVTAARSDNSMTVAAARHCYPGLLRRDATILEYQPMRLHTKLYVVDDAVYVGSANFDMRSLYLNLEVMLRIEDRALAARLRWHVDEEAAQSRRVTRALIEEKAGWWTRLRWRFAYFIVAVMDFRVTRRINFGSLGLGQDEWWGPADDEA